MTAMNLKGPGIDRTQHGHTANLAYIKGLAQNPQTATVFRQTFKNGIVDFYTAFVNEDSWRRLPDVDKAKYLEPILDSIHNAFKESLIILNSTGEEWQQRSKSFALEWLFCCLVHLGPEHDRGVAEDIANAAGYPLPPATTFPYI